MYYLAKWDSNWIDDLDVEGFTLMTREEMIAYKEAANRFSSHFEIGIGTNQQIDYGNGKEFLEEISFTEITDDEYHSLIKLFFDGNPEWLYMGYGHFPDLSTLLEIYDYYHGEHYDA